jgi:hypothetical protein
VALCLVARPAAAITLQVDTTTYDTTNFFGGGNPQGATAGMQAKAALEAAASYFSSILLDSFTAIQTPAPFHSSALGSTGVVTWSWQERFQHPSDSNPNEVIVTDPTVNSNKYIIYAGAAGLAGSTAGVGGPGGFAWSSNVSGTNLWTQADIDQITLTTASFENAVETRGQAFGFSRWGGAITFDKSARIWHYDHTTAPLAGETDFYSVAIHELGHAIGFGEQIENGTSVWESLLSGTTFSGSNAKVLNSGNNVPLAAGLAHWAAGTGSVVYGSSTAQEASMDPDLLDGTRKRFTALDAAALKDIGWELTTPPGVPGDYNNNGKVDAADYVLWRNGGPLANEVSTLGVVNAADYTAWRARFGNTSGSGSGAIILDGAVPEPTGAAMFLLGGVLLGATHRLRMSSRAPALDP